MHNVHFFVRLTIVRIDIVVCEATSRFSLVLRSQSTAVTVASGSLFRYFFFTVRDREIVSSYRIMIKMTISRVRG